MKTIRRASTWLVQNDRGNAQEEWNKKYWQATLDAREAFLAEKLKCEICESDRQGYDPPPCVLPGVKAGLVAAAGVCKYADIIEGVARQQ